jgi:hypothetical protein
MRHVLAQPASHELAMPTSQDQSLEFRTPVRRLAATFTFACGASQEGVLFCPPGEDVDRLLSSPEPFLPIEVNGKVRLVARRTLAIVSTPLGYDFDEEGTITRRATVMVRLIGDGEIDGEIAFAPRPGRPRVLDFLNEPTPRLRLWGSNAVHHISKECIDSVEER